MPNVNTTSGTRLPSDALLLYVEAERYSLEWMHRHPRPDPDTSRHCRAMVHRFGIDFSGKLLHEITLEDAQGWAVENPAAVRYVRAMFVDAKEDRYVDDNVFARVRTPRIPPRRRHGVPEVEEIDSLIAAAQRHVGSYLAAAVEWSAFVGTRQSETLALGWPDVQFHEVETVLPGRTFSSRTRARVCRQLGRRGVMKPLKGQSIEREVIVPPRVTDRLLGLPVRSGRLFRTEAGEALTHSRLRTGWDLIREETGLPIEWHQLRTFCAVWLLERGADPFKVSLQLHGHTNPATVLKFYALVDRERQLDDLEDLVG